MVKLQKFIRCLYAGISGTLVLAFLRDMVTMSHKQMPGRGCTQTPENVYTENKIHTQTLHFVLYTPCVLAQGGLEAVRHLETHSAKQLCLFQGWILFFVCLWSSILPAVSGYWKITCACLWSVTRTCVFHRFVSLSLFPQPIFQAIRLKWAIFSIILNSEQNQKVG